MDELPGESAYAVCKPAEGEWPFKICIGGANQVYKQIPKEGHGQTKQGHDSSHRLGWKQILTEGFLMKSCDSGLQ